MTTDQRQDAELDDHQHRLERLEQVFPTPDTPQGGAQRARIHIPTPDSLLTVGARGTGTTRGRPEGPGGVAIFTVENLGAEVHGATILDTDGNTIVHSGEQVAVVAEGDAAISSNAHIRVGSIEDIEITAGLAGFTDPAFTVRPSIDVPAPPEVDTASPREGVESIKTAWSAVWRAWSIRTALRSWESLLGGTAGVQGAALERNVATCLSATRATVTLGEALRDSLMAIGSAFDDPNAAEAEGAKLKVHAAGGISMTSPAKISVFSQDAVSIGAPYDVSLKGGWKASLKSGGNAKVYGIATVTLGTEGVAGIKGKVVSTKGDFIETKAKQAASLTSEGKVLVEAKAEAVLNGETVAVGGNEVNLAARDTLRLDSKTGTVEVHAQQRVEVRSDEQIALSANNQVQLSQQGASVNLTDGEVRLSASQMTAKLDSSSFEVAGFKVERNRIRIRAARVDLG